jgi:hypothetical protein
MLFLSSPVALSCPDFLERRSLTSFKSLRGLAGGLVIPAAAAGHKANSQRCIQRQKDCIGKRKLAHKIIFQFINSPHVAFLVHLRLIYPSASRHTACVRSPLHLISSSFSFIFPCSSSLPPRPGGGESQNAVDCRHAVAVDLRPVEAGSSSTALSVPRGTRESCPPRCTFGFSFTTASG